MRVVSKSGLSQNHGKEVPMSQDKALIIQLKSALESNERLDVSQTSKAVEKLKKVLHSLSIKDFKRAQILLEQFTQQLVQMLRN